ncbi:hypothetical protein [Hahella chejuensis]|uniref:hypothetical protein n=1 Tax=Hahella chejuensis TaxID=158327 RepID=UPI0005A29F0A|nr:hypothetical protein [Hahella chejuensis]
MGNNKQGGVEVVTEKFIDEFLRIHPRGGLPLWFRNKTTHQTLDKGDSWQLSIVASKNHRKPGNSNVVIDEKTGEKRYVIADSYEEIVLFSMRFRKSDLSGEVIVDTDFSQIDSDQLVGLN